MRTVSLGLLATTLSRRTLHQAASGKPLDLTFLVSYKPHALFSRGNAVKLKEIFDQSDTVKAEIFTRKKFVRICTSRRSAYNLKRVFIAPPLQLRTHAQEVNTRRFAVDAACAQL